MMFISSFSYSQLQGEDLDIKHFDSRVLMHYSYDDLSSMDSLKYEMIKYYYCDSYILDTTNSVNFNLDTFDISSYEHLRKDSNYSSIEEDGVIITLIPKNECIYYMSYNPKNKRKS